MGMGTKRGLEEPAELGRMLAVPQSQVYREVLEANSEYAKQFGDKCNLALPPARAFAILTCMDARLDPAKYAGLSEGDAHVIRNAGGRASDNAIRSLVISHKLLGTGEWFVIHHTNCGMELFSDEIIADLLEDDLATASFDGKTWSNPHHKGGHSSGHFIKWHTIQNQETSVEQDVRPEFWGEVQPPASLKGLDIPSRRADLVPWKPSRRRGCGRGNPTFSLRNQCCRRGCTSRRNPPPL